jgi:hypothetical protein
VSERIWMELDLIHCRHDLNQVSDSACKDHCSTQCTLTSQLSMIAWSDFVLKLETPIDFANPSLLIRSICRHATVTSAWTRMSA